MHRAIVLLMHPPTSTFNKGLGKESKQLHDTKLHKVHDSGNDGNSGHRGNSGHLGQVHSGNEGHLGQAPKL